MKILNILIVLAFLSVVALGVYAWWSYNFFTNELNKKRTEAARAARWNKQDVNENDKANETENKENTN